MKVEQVVFPVMRTVAKHDWSSRLGNKVLKPWNPFNPERYVNPYPLYEQVRRVGNVTYQRSLQSWNVMSYAEAEHVLRAPTTSVDRTELLGYLTPYTKLQPSTLELFTSTMLMKDPPGSHPTALARQSGVYSSSCRGPGTQHRKDRPRTSVQARR